MESASSDTESKEDVKPTKESIQSLYDDVQRIVPVYDTSDVGKARYLIEHQMLRDMFFSQPEKTIHILLSPNGLYDLISIYLKKMSFENPYRPEDIQIDALRRNSDLSLVSIELPEPEYVPLCYRIYLFYSDTYSNLGYYTIERNVDDHAFLCRWNKQCHQNIRQMKSAVWPEKEKGVWKAIEASILIDLHSKNNNLKQEHENTDKDIQYSSIRSTVCCYHFYRACYRGAWNRVTAQNENVTSRRKSNSW